MVAQLFLLFGAGIASFLAPCVVALVPAYVGAVAGDPAARQGRPVLPVVTFVAGFSATFAALGAAAGALGDGLARLEAPLRLLGGAVLLVMGLRLLGVVGGRLAGEWRPGLTRLARPLSASPGPVPRDGLATRDGPGAVATVLRAPSDRPAPSGLPRFLRPLTLGAAFAAGWTPCVGPVLAAALTAAATGADPLRGAALLGAYGVGLGTPFLIVALGIQATSVRRMAAVGARFERIAGGILVVLGALLLTDTYDVLAAGLAGLAPQIGSA